LDITTGLRTWITFNAAGELADLAITETVDEMIVYHSNRLHVGIHDCRTNETESAMLKVLAEGIGFDGSPRDLSHDLPAVKLWMPVNEAPAIGVETSKLILDLRNARALRTAASIFMRLRMMSEFNASFSIRRTEYRATFWGSNPSKARR
jgi:hypothetical protein